VALRPIVGQASAVGEVPERAGGSRAPKEDAGHTLAANGWVRHVPKDPPIGRRIIGSRLAGILLALLAWGALEAVRPPGSARCAQPQLAHSQHAEEIAAV
jgi:hypothetical protein